MGARVRVVSNPRAGGGRAAATWASLARKVPGAERLEVHAPESLAGLAQLAPELAASDLVIVVGGDGTLAAVLSAVFAALARARPPTPTPAPTPALGEARAPAFALVPAGTMGTVHAGLGARASPASLAAALAWARAPSPGGLVRAPTLAIEHDDPDDARSGLAGLSAHGGLDRGRTSVGFFAALGLVSRYFARYAATSGGPRAAASLALRVTLSAVAGGALAREVFAPVPARVRVDDRDLALEALTLLVAGTLPHVGLGLSPLPRTADAARADDGTFAFAASDAPARRLAAALPAVLAARGLGGVVGRGIDALARHVEVTFPVPTPFVLDGDVLTTRRLVLRAGPAVRLVAASLKV